MVAFCPRAKKANELSVIFLSLVKFVLSSTQYSKSACPGQFGSTVTPRLAIQVLLLHQHSTHQLRLQEKVWFDNALS